MKLDNIDVEKAIEKPVWKRTSKSGRFPIEAVKVPNRNDLCPCGSGKKYKKCCMAVDSRIIKQAEEIRKNKNVIEL